MKCCVFDWQGAKPARAGLTAYLGHVENGNADLTLLSNDIPVLSTPPPDIPSDSDEEENMGRVIISQ